MNQSSLTLPLLFVFCFFCFNLHAQAPYSFNYQGQAKDASGSLINQPISLRISILESTEDGEIVYSETHAVTTNTSGRFSIRVGEGANLKGDLSNIDWGEGIYFIETELDPQGGDAFITMGTSQIVSVPYALYAKKAGSVDSDQSWQPGVDGIFYKEGPVGIGKEPADGALDILGSINVMQSSNDDDFIILGNPNGDPRIVLNTDPGGTSGLLQVLGPAGNDNFIITSRNNDPSKGFFGISDNGAERLQGYISDSGSGRFETLGPEGTLNFLATSRANNANAGWAGVTDDDGDVKVGMTSTDEEAGLLFTNGPNGNFNFFVSSRVDDANSGFAAVTGSNGNVLAGMFENVNASGALIVSGSNGQLNFGVDARNQNTDFGRAYVSNDSGQRRAVMTINDGGDGVFQSLGPNNLSNALVGGRFSAPDFGVISLFDDSENLKVDLGVLENGEGNLVLNGPNGKLNISAGGGIDDNTGSVLIFDGNGDVQAGIIIDDSGDGIITGDIKNFRTEHPVHSDKEIWYASLEGPEVGIYTRGTGMLSEGVDTVFLPEHFSALVDEQSLTTILTPRHWDTYGLATIEATKEYIIVRDLKGGKGNFAYDWEIKGIRAEHQDFQVIRDRQTSLTALNKKHSTHNMSLGTLKKDRQELPKAIPNLGTIMKASEPVHKLQN